MTLLLASSAVPVAKCGHGLLLAQLVDETLHVIATDRGRLILARCDGEPLGDTSPRSAARREGTECDSPATEPFKSKRAT